MKDAVVGVFGFTATVMSVAVVIPAAFQSGHGGTAILIVLIWFIIRIAFGKEEADDYLAQIEEQSKDDQPIDK